MRWRIPRWPRPSTTWSATPRRRRRRRGGGAADPFDFTWLDADRLVRFGAGSVDDAPELLADRGLDPFVLLTTPRAAVDAPGLVSAASDVAHVPPGPVPEAAAAVRGAAAGRPLVALGGGRVIDAAKAIAGADGLVCAAVPTTLSGAELSRVHRMPAGVAEFRLVRPAVVVADPALMASQPLPALAASAMNALAHAVEALYAPLANPVAEAAALEAAGRIAEGLVPKDPERRSLALGALLGSYALGSAGYALHHVLCQTLVRLAGTPHAETNAVVLPHVVAAMASRAPREIGLLARSLGASGGAESAAPRVAALAARSGATRLSELGVRRADLPAVVGEALARPELRNTPGAPTQAELERLLTGAL